MSKGMSGGASERAGNERLVGEIERKDARDDEKAGAREHGLPSIDKPESPENQRKTVACQ